jgi:predicted SAM-dependent methyltransferase
MKFLNLGCGNRYHKSWINIDFTSTGEGVLAYDLTKGIPFDDNTFDVVYHSHVLEHFSKKDAVFFLKECFRVLKKNGIIRIAVPDLENIAKIYIEQLEAACKGIKDADLNYDWIVLELYDQTVRNWRGGNMAEYINQDNLRNEAFVMARHGLEAKNLRINFLNKKKQTNTKAVSPTRLKGLFDLNSYKQKLLKLLLGKDFIYYEIGKFRMSGEIHQWMYDRFSLSRLLLQTGFTQPKIQTAFSSRIPNWNAYELESKEGIIFKPDSLFIEAIKTTNV